MENQLYACDTCGKMVCSDKSLTCEDCYKVEIRKFFEVEVYRRPEYHAWKGRFSVQGHMKKVDGIEKKE